METKIIDELIAPNLVPAILGLNIYETLHRGHDNDYFYLFVSSATILSSLYTVCYLFLARKIRSRRSLTLLNSALLTTFAILTIFLFNTLRINISHDYQLPKSIQKSDSSKSSTSSSDVFKYHLYADFIPGLILTSQIKLCSLISFELLNKAKRKFSFGEATIVAQLASACYGTFALVLYSEFTGAGPFKVSLTTNIALSIGGSIFLVAFLPCYLFVKNRATVVRCACISLSAALSLARVSYLISQASDLDPLTWLIEYIMTKPQRLSLFILWSAILTGCVTFSINWSRKVGQTNSLVRKFFHAAICVVFVTGYNQDVEFTSFAASGILCIMFLLEIVRAWNIKLIGWRLEEVCRSLRGKWDNKFITLSHIYLLIGTFLPLWITPNEMRKDDKLLVSCGLISVGIGDAAAAIVGTLFGKTTIRRKTSKTIEGLAANVISMIIFKLVWVGYSDFVGEFSFVMSAALTALVEVASNNCDNLILPLIMIMCLHVF